MAEIATGRDTLSDVLRSVRLRSAMFYLVSCNGRWVAEAPRSEEIASIVMPDADRVIEYHVVTAGECWAAIVGEPPVRMQRGDILLLPHGDAHVISSAPGLRADPYLDSYREMQQHTRPFRIHYGDGAPPQIDIAGSSAAASAARSATTTLVCGFIGCDARPYNPLLATLPRLLHLPASSGAACGEQFVRLAASESAARRPGSEALLERMSEMMFVDAIRRHIELLPEDTSGWLAGLRDRHVGRALALLHERPAASWTLEELGRQVGLSRSALHERFSNYIGLAPMQYLASWRMQLAARLLRETPATVASIALDVGYESEAAFVRAFKRLVGLPPAAWRRSQGRALTAS